MTLFHHKKGLFRSNVAVRSTPTPSVTSGLLLPTTLFRIVELQCLNPDVVVTGVDDDPSLPGLASSISTAIELEQGG